MLEDFERFWDSRLISLLECGHLLLRQERGDKIEVRSLFHASDRRDERFGLSI